MFNKLKKRPYIVLAILVFIFMFIFFTNIRPLIVFDADDWTYVSAARQFIPIINDWNPARVLPEVLMPLCGSIASFLIYPITGDYIGSFSIIFAIVISFLIALYFFSFANMIEKVFNFKTKTSLAVTILFFLFHFILFASANKESQYMFLAHDVTCYFYYLIPNLINFIIVFTLMSRENIDYSLSKYEPWKLGMILLILYIAIFSNLYCSIVLAVFAGSELLINFFKEFNKKFNFKNFVKKYLLLIGIIVAWFISAIFELTGGRADMAPKTSFLESFSTTIINFSKSLMSLNKIILLFFLIVTISFFIVWLIDLANKKTNQKSNQLFLKILISIIVISIYFIFLSAKVNPSYVLSVVYIYGFWAYILILELLGICYLIKRNDLVLVALPFLIVFFLVRFNCVIGNLKESNVNNFNSTTCKEISNDIVYQLKEADSEGKTKVYLHVPYYNSDDNWPQATYLGDRISNTLYKHKITTRRLDIEIVRDKEYNKKYNINYS